MAGIDKWGSWNTGAVPLYKNGSIIGIVSADIEDLYIQRSLDTSFMNTIILSITMVVVLGALLGAIVALLRRVQRIQTRLYTIANYDNITGLPNRHYLFNYLNEIHTRTVKEDFYYAVMFIDLDNFKQVNDSSGHDAGDELLRYIAAFLSQAHEQIAKTFHPHAGLFNVSARLGGDEFLQLIPGSKDTPEAAIAAQRLFDSFRNQQHIQEFVKNHGVGMSIGIALFPRDSADYNTLITFADVAMYHAKAAGKNRFAIYDESMSHTIDELDLSVRRNNRC
jgi:diguanylate cyclase (GGDEF)-like protein